MLTTCLFKKPLYTTDIIATHEDFKVFVYVPIDELHPNQLNLDMDVVKAKRKNHSKNSTLYTVYQDGHLILIDGHHTVAGKMLDGIKKVKTLFFATTKSN